VRLKHAPAALYIDLHAKLRVEAATLAPGVLASAAVTPIARKSGGQRIVDTFSINCSDQVSMLAGQASFRRGTVEMLVPPLDVDFKTAPSTNQGKQKSEILVRGGFVRLHAGAFVDGNASTPSWQFPHGVPPPQEEEEACEARRLHEHDLKQAVATSLRAINDKEPSAVPLKLMQWLAALSQ
jgi:hypothetical protein